MDNPIISALRRARQTYMTNVGEPAAQLVGGGVRGYLGLDAPEYADSRGMEAYRNAAAISNTPVVGMPSMAVRAGAKAAPAIAQSLREHAKGFQEYNRALGPAGASQMVVWHGSPHKFDKFDSSKIGTGEGAQAYGHGLYLAESPDVAKEYQRNLSSTGGAKNLANQFGNVDGAIAEAQKRIANYKEMIATGDSGIKDRAQRMLRISEKNLQDLQAMKAGLPENTGALYKVDLPDEKIARMLDWDKPLSQQTKAVRDYFEPLTAKRRAVDAQAAGPEWGDLAGPQNYDPTGGELLQLLGNVDRMDAAAVLSGGTGGAQTAALLRSAGIPGIRYLDASSRGVGQGTSNFVVFPGEEAALTILERNNEIINALRKRKN